MKLAELKKLAVDIVEGKVFGTWNIPSYDQHLVPLIFVPLSFMDAKQLKKLKRRKVVHVYEYLDKAAPKTVNGYPIFFSFRLLKKRDWKRLVRYVKRFEKMKKEFLER